MLYSRIQRIWFRFLLKKRVHILTWYTIKSSILIARFSAWLHGTLTRFVCSMELPVGNADGVRRVLIEKKWRWRMMKNELPSCDIVTFGKRLAISWNQLNQDPIYLRISFSFFPSFLFFFPNVYVIFLLKSIIFQALGCRR